MKTIRITGQGKLRVHPDMTVITMELKGQYRDYDETLRRSSEDTEQIKDILSAFGFERADLKTLNFNVETEYERYDERHGTRTEFKRRFAGYSFSHTLKVEFASDNKRLGKILFALANSPLNPELRISYTVRDREAAKNELMVKAVSDARGKASVLAEAAGITLGAIQSVDYSWREFNFEISPMKNFVMEEKCMVSMAEDSYDMDIEPDDIEITDTVTIIWEIGSPETAV